MSSTTRLDRNVDRRDFLKTGVAAVVGSVAAGSGIVAAGEPSNDPKPIPTRPFGKTGRVLPILGYGGAALPKVWGNPLSTEDRVKLVRYAYDQGVRYFDTAGNYMESQPILGEGLKGIRDKVYLVTKVETTVPAEVRGAVEKALEQLQTDYLDAILIHGTPGLEQMTVDRAMKIHDELVKLRDEKITRFIGFSAHSYFDKALALISSGAFDQCMLSYGYLPRGYNQVLSARMVALRDACVAKAHELGMGIAAMKVVGGGVLGAWSGYIVPGFDRKRLEQLPAAAIRYVLDDDRVDLLVIGMRLEKEVDANIKTLSGDVTYTLDDRAGLAEFCAQAYDSDAIKKMKID
ncbi:MAG: aldo/keto reductase [Planctomycetota bacterium]|jgi:predicted aldo/keto reductase-like oxidoreductase